MRILLTAAAIGGVIGAAMFGFAVGTCAQQSVSVPGGSVDTSQFASKSDVQAAQTAATAAQAAAASAQASVPSQAAMAAAAPVQSVNTNTGAVIVPTRAFARGTITPSTTTGSGTLTFATQSDMLANFKTAPTCYFTVQSSNTNYVFAELMQTSVDATQVSVNLQAALKILGITLGALTIWGAPPAGTVINATCSAPS